MSFGDFAAGLWAFITGAGVLLLGPGAALAWSNWITAAAIVIASISSMVRMPRQRAA